MKAQEQAFPIVFTAVRMGLFLCFALAPALARYACADREISQAASFLIWYCIGVGCAAVAVGLAASYTGRIRAEESIRKAELDDLTGVGLVVDALNAGTSRLDRRCRDTLLRVLPRLSGHDAYLLDEYRQARLRFFVLPPAGPMFESSRLRGGRDAAQRAALKVAIVELLGRIGDREALTLMNDLITSKPNTRAGSQIVEAAKRSLPILLERVATEPSRSSLLRPVPGSEGLELVRAVPTQEADLLRSVTTPLVQFCDQGSPEEESDTAQGE